MKKFKAMRLALSVILTVMLLAVILCFTIGAADKTYNVALEANATASFTNPYGNHANHAIDGNAVGDVNEYVWNNWSDTSNEATFTLNWNSEYTLTSLSVKWWADSTATAPTSSVTYPKTCKVQYLDESGEWQTVTGMINGDGESTDTVGVSGSGTKASNTIWNEVSFAEPVTTTALRLVIERSGTGKNGVGIAELEVYGTEMKNVATKATVTAPYNNASAGVVSAVCDGVLADSKAAKTWNTYCADANLTYPMPLVMEWDVPYTLDGMRIMWWADNATATATGNVTFPKSCILQYLDDVGEWQTLTGMTNELGETVDSVGVTADTKVKNGLNGYNKYWNVVTFAESVETTSIRLLIDRSGSEKNGFGVSEWQVFGSTEQVQFDNIALDAVVTATYTNGSSGADPAYVNDNALAGKSGTVWDTYCAQGNLTYPLPLVMEWDTPVALDSMRVMWWADNKNLTAASNVTFPKSCDVEYFDHATDTWVKLTAMTDENGESVSSVGVKYGTEDSAASDAANYLNGNNRYWNSVKFEETVKTTKIRLLIDRNGTNKNGIGIGEWQVYGEEITAEFDEIVLAEISGEKYVDKDNTAQYTVQALPVGLTNLEYSWLVAEGSEDIIAIEGSDNGNTVTVKGVGIGKGTLVATVSHVENGQTVSRKAEFEVVVEGILSIDTYKTSTAAGRSPILPKKVVANGLVFDVPTESVKSTTKPDFDFGEEFNSSLVDVTWESVDPTLYADDKVGTVFTVKGTVNYKGEVHEALAEITVNTAATTPVANHSVTFENVTLTDDFWTPKQETNAMTSIGIAIGKIEEASGGEPNFLNAIKKLNGEEYTKFIGWFFQDTDIYKSIEAISYTLSNFSGSTDPAILEQKEYLESKVAYWISLIEQVQYADGYIDTYFTLRDTRPTASQHRYMDMDREHELYNVGHLLEGVVAYTRYREQSGDPDYSLYVVGKRAADQVVALFGPGGSRFEVSGHPEIELALVKFASLVEEYEGEGEGQKYIDTAKLLIDRRGSDLSLRESGYSRGDYCQDKTPFVEETNAVGHAVRACYLYAGVTDIATLLPENDPDRIEYLNALDAIWESVTYKKTYISGGIGVKSGAESFGGDYQLPNDNSYCETCASIALANWNLRMNLVHEDGKYIDSMERSLYNGVLAGVNLKGDRFYYDSLLEVSNGNARSAWFGCACCPPNLMRTVAKLSEYIYTVHGDSVAVNLYIASEGNFDVNGTNVNFTQETYYPWDGAVKLTVTPETDKEFTVKIRIPGWVEQQYNKNVTITVNGTPVTSAPEKGYVSITRTWEEGDTVLIDIPMEIRRTEADPNVITNAGRIALERGPLVYCMEKAGNAQINNDTSFNPLNFVIPRDASLKASYNASLLRGVVEITGTVKYANGDTVEEAALQAVPYYAWNNRGDDGVEGQNCSSKMLIWTIADGDIPDASNDPEANVPSVKPIEIGSAEELVALMGASSALSGHYKLTNNIDLTDFEQKPISSFTGTFDGMGYAISGINITGDSNVGLFGVANGTAESPVVIKNLTINGKVEGTGDNVGGIIGKTAGYVEISNVTNYCEVSSDGNNVGGIIGYVLFDASASGDMLSVTDTVNNGVIYGKGERVGGIVGYVEGNADIALDCGIVISKCANYNAVTSDGNCSGGIIGYIIPRSGKIACTLTELYNEGDISGAKYIGGIIGYISVSTAGTITVKNVMNTGDITATDSVTSSIIGGAVGGSKDILYQNAYTSGTVNCTGGYVGAHLGVWRNIVPDGNLFYLDNGTVYNNTDGATKVTAETLLVKDTFVGLLDDSAWIYVNGNGPELKVFHKHTEEIIPAVAPTYTSTGLTEGKKCSGCDEILVAQEEIPKLTLKGDFDGDGAVTIADALILIRVIVNDQTVENGDVNGDGKVGLADVIRVMKLIIK